MGVNPSHSLSCRPLNAKDIPSICTFPQNEDELYFFSPKASYPLMSLQLETAIVNRSDPTVVEFDGTVVGFANFYRWKMGGECSIGNVIVAKHARGVGVGQYIIEEMIRIAFSKYQATGVIISCFNKNIAGLLLYPKIGFQPYAIEERVDKKGSRIALIHMRLSNIFPKE